MPPGKACLLLSVVCRHQRTGAYTAAFLSDTGFSNLHQTRVCIADDQLVLLGNEEQIRTDLGRRGGGDELVSGRGSWVYIFLEYAKHPFVHTRFRVALAIPS